ncbi:Glycine betaine ABC transport system, ATP-binding protein OpuAA [hydrothermal vent metagenome]|uniref:Glycine betaine ABC transport system, ATP-binding protein OpuAA n=1 Tax=hydrothermal vent metagenome TaxID=652676 RepID=A0A3B0T699_9ZZZZ
MPLEKVSSGGTRDDRPVKLACRSVWKVFGDGAAGLFRGGGQPGDAALADGPFIAAVRDVTLDVVEGEIFIIMGLSGSGKSTLVRCMTRLIEPTWGEVLFDGQDLVKASARELTALRRHKMGMVFQHFALLPHRTVLGNVGFPLEVQGVARGPREASAMEAIELVGLAGREQYYPAELSGGQQQRVGIARSLVVKPDVWFLDEPFSALDPLIRREMQDEFLRLQSVLRKTIVFITHDFEEAIRLADRIAIMKDGKIVQIGTSEDLVLNPATDYVEEFTRGIPRTKVLTAAAIAGPPGDGPFAGMVPASAKVGTLVSTVLTARTNAVFRVEDEAGCVVGQLTAEDIIAVLSTETETP